LLDTSVVIALPMLGDPSQLPDECYISAITLAELSVGPLAATDATERAKRLSVLQQVESDFDPIPFDAACSRAFGRVSSALRQQGRPRKARAYDALIAATALARDLPLYTANPDDVAGIPGLQIRPVSPHR
jgi:predicted nucleic acid-binding protein